MFNPIPLNFPKISSSVKVPSLKTHAAMMQYLLTKSKPYPAGEGLELFTGTYTGDGVATQSIVGVGCQPILLWIIPRQNYYAGNICGWGLKSTQDGLNSSCYRATGTTFRYSTDNIISLDADGFTVGDGSTIGQNLMNIVGLVYNYVCWGLGSGLNMFGGTYNGNGAATQAIVGVGFQPRFVYVHTPSATGGGGSPNAVKSDQDALSSLVYWTGGNGFHYFTDQIISLDADGFTVGDGSGFVSLLNELGDIFWYVCFR